MKARAGPPRIALLAREGRALARLRQWRTRRPWPEPTSHAAAFDDWASRAATAFNAANPDMPAFRYPDDFDGCSLVPDLARFACLLHDLRCHFRYGAGPTDRLLRLDIASMAATERPPWGWTWHVMAWAAWAGVKAWRISRGRWRT